MDRLDEESADLDFLEENLKNTEALTEKMTSMLNVFDDRLVRLENSILPIHKSTLTLTKLAENIDRTRNGVLEVIGYFDLVEREEMTIKRGPNENDLESYLNSIGKCKKAIEVLGGMRLKSSEKVIGQLKQLLRTAILQLEDLFRLWLKSRSNPIEPLSYITKNLDVPGIPQGPLQKLATLSSYLSTFSPELSYNSDFVKVYVEVRSNYLTKSLKTLAQGSISTAEKRSTPVYEKGTCGFNSYTDAILKMFKTEYEIAEKILPSESIMSGYRDAIQMPLDNYVETGRTLNNRVKKNMQTDVFLAFDMMESLNKNVGAFEEVFRLAGKKDSAYGELLHALRGVALRSFPEFIDEIKSYRTKTTSLPNDGTIHELTITTLQHLKRLTDYQETVETMLLTLGDNNWNTSEKDANFSRDKTGRGVSGSVVIQHYFADVLESLTVTLDFKAKSYKKTALIYPEIEIKYEKMVKKCNDGYQETWRACFANLMDYTSARGGSLKTALGSNEKSNVKEKFKNFNTEFEEMYKVHKGYAIPDLDLRSQVIKDIKVVLMPVYNRFLDKYQQTEFSKNPTKYIRYDPQTLENMVNGLFDGSIY